MAKKAPERKVVKYDARTQAELLDDVQDHESDSYKWMATLRDKFDEKESMLIVQLEDAVSKANPDSKIFDPRLSTIVFERAARVMAQNPKGKAYAVSKDDLGKNMLMNLMLKHYEKNANEQFSHLIKLRLLDLYSLVYGTMFGLVPWRVNSKNGYLGPELNILPIRDCRPQPGIKNVSEADWFGVRNVVSIDWLLNQSPDSWMNVDALAQQLKAAKSEGDGKTQNKQQNKSYVERTYFPGNFGDVVFPQVETFTEYRGDKWITWTPQVISQKTSKPLILRVVEDPYPDYMLPIVKKDAFPLLDSPIGLGEFERGKTLQYAVNSLINLYMQGVKYSIFPPLAVNPDNVVPSSMKWGAGEKWYMNNPGADVQTINLSPQGLQTFQSTYGFLIGALESQAGTTSTSESQGSQGTLGKTPEAIKFISNREGARDEWDRFMMEDTINQIYTRWISLTVEKQETDVELRLYKQEIEDIQKSYPDVADMYRSGERGSVKVNKNMLAAKYDYELETGSTMKPNVEGEQQNLTSILKAVIENQAIGEAFKMQGKMIDIPELFKRWMISGGVKDWDKIIVPIPAQQPIPADSMAEVPPEQQIPGIPGGGQPPLNPQQVPPQMPQSIPPEAAQQVAAPVAPQQMPPQPPMAGDAAAQIQDPDIANMVAQMMGGNAGIPVGA